MNILIKNVTILDANSKYHQQVVDVLVENGSIKEIKKNIDASVDTYDYAGHILSVGFCDLVTQIADPGFEHRDTISTIAKSAIAGGFTAICAMPNNLPITQNKAAIQYIKSNAQNTAIEIYPIAALTQNFDGKTPTEMLDLHHAGAIAFSDIPNTSKNAGILSRALLYTKQFDGLVIEMPFDSDLIADACVHESELSVRLGLKGIPNIAEYLAVYQAIEILKYTGGNLHLTGISCKESLDLVAKAKADKLNITASCFVHHLVSTENELLNYNSNFKVFPPLRSDADRLALIQGVKDKTIDCVATQHTPLDTEHKELEFEYAAFGMLGLETALSLLLTDTDIELERIVEVLATNPRQLIKQSSIIAEQSKADFVIIDPNKAWTFTEKHIQSLSKNSPYINKQLKGSVKAIFSKNNFIIHE
ncbi:MAG: dihydroorotase [Sphingobacteriales bacterium]|nr:MAG: dihydroorotase [Sphingobacteriales bacterium]